MSRSVVFWILAMMITVASAYYQRMTGPTRAVRGDFTLQGQAFSYTLDRSHAGSTDAGVTMPADDPKISGVLEWKRYKTDDPWTILPMTRTSGTLHADLPNQPPAGKLQYRVKVSDSNSTLVLPSDEGVVIRFKGEVPIPVLVVHVFAMFLGMLLSTRTGLEFFNPTPQIKNLALWTMGFLFVGGLLLGPIVQKYAFGAYWTGWPFGTDLTDNKTLIAWAAWAAVFVAAYRSRVPERWALAAAIITITVFVIPHSAFGSELDYKALDKQAVHSPK